MMHCGSEGKAVKEPIAIDQEINKRSVLGGQERSLPGPIFGKLCLMFYYI